MHEQGDLDPALLINTALPDACIAERAGVHPRVVCDLRYRLSTKAPERYELYRRSQEATP